MFGSCMGSNLLVNSSFAVMSESLFVSSTESFSKGSRTLTSIGPTFVFSLSRPRILEVLILCCFPSTAKVKEASMIFKLGYKQSTAAK